MTVSTTNNRVSYAGNGVTTVFSFPNKFLADADLVVLDVLDSTGAETVKTLTTHYTVSGAGDEAGGSVTMLTAPASGHTLVIYRDPALTQPIDLVNGDPLNVDTGIERGLDRATTQIQRVRDLIDRTMGIPDGDTGLTAADMKLPAKVSRASRYLAFDANGKPLASASSAGGAAVSPFMETVVDDLTADAAIATLLASANHNTTLATLQATRSEAGAVAVPILSKLRENISDIDFGTVKNGTTSDTTAIQNALNAVRITGGELELRAGRYSLPTTAGGYAVSLDYSGLTEEPITDPTRVSVTGDGEGSTVLLGGTAAKYTMYVNGGTGVASHIYTKLSKFSIGNGVAGAYGLHLYNHAFAKLEDLTLQGLTVALKLESVLSSEFENLTIANGASGVVALKGTGFSDINADRWTGCEFRLLTSTAYAGGDHSNLFFSGCTVEGCGTHGNAATGGLDLTFTGAEGSVGFSDHGGYYEGNGGGWDINLTNTGAEYVTHVFVGTNFNRTSNTNFVTNNIKSTGKNRIVLIGCTFDGYGTYVPDAGRPYVNGDTNTRVVAIGCKFDSATEQGALRNLETSAPYAGSVAASGTANKLPVGWSSTKPSAGVYQITHNLGLATTDYAVVASTNTGTALTVERCITGANIFNVVTTTPAGVLTDADFTFIMSVI